jgi:hypothetical protein
MSRLDIKAPRLALETNVNTSSRSSQYSRAKTLVANAHFQIQKNVPLLSRTTRLSYPILSYRKFEPAVNCGRHL